jgi:hypothetical protein
MGWKSGEQVISTWPRAASARKRGTTRPARARERSSRATFSSWEKPRSFASRRATSGSSRRAQKPIQARMKWT